MTIVAISGKRRSGKSFLGAILEKDYGFTPISLAAPLKHMIRTQFGLTMDQTDGHLKEIVDVRYCMTPRDLMIKFGAFYRSIDPDFWVKKLFDQMKQTPQAQLGRYVITDMRFRNELDWFRRHNAFLVRLERSETFTGRAINDPSECELDSFNEWDVHVQEQFNQDESDMKQTASRVVAHVA
jgi:phosphomevalonate kinase